MKKIALSTNWCNLRLESGEEIADEAMALGFDELELGFNTTMFQTRGFKARLDRMPVGSVHAFAPVPISAPQGYPELYQLASTDENMRAIARVHVSKNIAFAADMGATALVLHAGRAMCDSWFASRRRSKRLANGRKLVDILKKEFELLVPELEKNNVKLGLENLPYPEGFPDEAEIGEVTGPWVRPWLDTGHDHVRRINEFWGFRPVLEVEKLPGFMNPVGLHINDSKGGDDHFAPGEGEIDFRGYREAMLKAEHLVFEPHQGVSGESLRKALALIRNLLEN